MSGAVSKGTTNVTHGLSQLENELNSRRMLIFHLVGGLMNVQCLGKRPVRLKEKGEKGV